MKLSSGIAKLVRRALLVSAIIGIFSLAFPQEEEKPEQCCYTNPAFVGVCKVTPGKDETCDSILEYLNTAGTVGKSYCGGNKIRGGWQQVDCSQENQ